ncbi:MAG TPA: MarR family winged helix-turn-helix transcriptional regulator [Ktedonobacterales bacterium]|jgi:DNA-binding MarR family transcriptional regulator
MTADSIPFDRLMIGATLNLLSQAINRRIVETLHSQGFADYRPAFHPVFQWCKPEGSRLSELAEMCGVTKSAMTQLVDVLVSLGYVERVPDPRDGRATLIRRTDRGWAVNRIASEVVEATQQEWSHALGPTDFAHVLEALRHLTRLVYTPVIVPRPES